MGGHEAPNLRHEIRIKLDGRAGYRKWRRECSILALLQLPRTDVHMKLIVLKHRELVIRTARWSSSGSSCANSRSCGVSVVVIKILLLESGRRSTAARPIPESKRYI